MDKDSNILLYSTHTDESYIPSDGSHTKPGKGGILDVAESFKNALQKRGINAVLDKTPHEPHDAAGLQAFTANGYQSDEEAFTSCCHICIFTGMRCLPVYMLLRVAGAAHDKGKELR